MRYCDQCKIQLSDSAKFCPFCGTLASFVSDDSSESENRHFEEKSTNTQGEGKQVGRGDREQRHSLASRSEVNTAGYLAKVVSLEKSMYTQTQMVTQLSERVDKLGHHEVFWEPDEPQHCEPDISFDDVKLFAGAGLTLGGIIGLFSGSIITGLVVGCLVGLVIMLALSAWDASSKNSSRREKFENEMLTYNEAIAADERRVQNELNEKSKLNGVLKTIASQKRETQQILDQYYKMNIIFPKYRNLVAVCSFYEYFISGRCTSLTGHEGAYNIYESELRLERICTKLDDIMSNLEQIKSNQYVLYEAIQEGNRIIENLVEESIKQSKLLKRTAENTALAAHYAETAANNAEACAWIGIANYVEKKN